MQTLYQTAILNAYAAMAGQGSKDALEHLHDGLREHSLQKQPTSSNYDVRALAAQYNQPVEKIQAAIDSGWKPPVITYSTR